MKQRENYKIDLLTYHFEAKLPSLPEKVIALRLLQHCSSTPGHPVDALLFHIHVSSQRCNPCFSDGENSPDRDHRNVPRQVCSFNTIRLPVTRYKTTKCTLGFITIYVCFREGDALNSTLLMMSRVVQWSLVYLKTTVLSLRSHSRAPLYVRARCPCVYDGISASSVCFFLTNMQTARAMGSSEILQSSRKGN